METKKTVSEAMALAGQLAKAARYVDAEGVLRQILAQSPDLLEANHMLGVVCHLSDRDDEAIFFLENAVNSHPGDLNFRLDLAGVLRSANRPDEAIFHLEQVLARDSMNERALVERGYCYWLKGDLPASFAAREVYRKAYPSYFRIFPRPQWEGEDLNGKVILLHAEQGLGDTIIFLRYVPKVTSLGARVLLMLHDPLCRLAENNLPEEVEIFSHRNILPDFDFHLPLMELPRLLKTDLATIPADIPYLSPHPGDVALWKAKLGPKKGFRVGLVWSGNPGQVENFRRSMPPAVLSPLVGIPGIEYFSLQKGPGAAEIASLPYGLNLRDETVKLNDMADTAALIANLDLVISVDTSPAHLCGAMGVPCWVPLCATAYYFYMMEREDCPWYPTMRLFRQKKRGEWGPVMARIASELTNLAKGNFNVGS
jgi:hypothetical protein